MYQVTLASEQFSSWCVFKQSTMNATYEILQVLCCSLDFVTSVFQNSGAVSLLHGQRAVDGVESTIKIIAYHSLSPSFSS